jgi:hypothetical protein
MAAVGLLSVSLIKGIMRETEVGSMCVPQKLPEWIALNRLRGHGCQACAAERRLGAIGGLYNNAANVCYGVPSPNDRKWPNAPTDEPGLSGLFRIVLLPLIRYVIPAGTFTRRRSSTSS